MHLVLVDGELAARAAVLDRLVEEKVRLHLEDLVAERDREGRDVLADLITRLQRLAEVVVDDAVEVRHRLLPVLLEEDEGVVRDAEVAAAGVDNGGEARVRKEVLVSTVPDILRLDGPLLHALRPLGPVRHRLHLVQATGAAYNLVRVESTEDSEGAWVARSGRAEADHCIVDEAVLLQLHHVVEVTIVLLRVHSETEDAVNVVKTLCLVQRKEVESCAGSVVCIEAGLVIYQFTRDLG